MAIIETLYLSFQITLPLNSHLILTITLVGVVLFPYKKKEPGFTVIKDMTPYVAQCKEEWMPYFRFAAS